MSVILIIEDDLNIGQLVQYNLKKENFEVYLAKTGEEGLRLARTKIPDIVILDLMLPGIDGFEACRILKSGDVTKNIPIIMLTAKSDEVDRIVGFEIGADDYVTKPFSPRELVLRVKAVLKRGKKVQIGVDKSVRFKDMQIDHLRHRVTIKRKEITLTLTEFKLLSYLVENKDKVIKRDSVLDMVWGYGADVFSRTVDTYITRLKKKIGDYGKYIKSIRGVGYTWKER